MVYSVVNGHRYVKMIIRGRSSCLRRYDSSSFDRCTRKSQDILDAARHSLTSPGGLIGQVGMKTSAVKSNDVRSVQSTIEELHHDNYLYGRFTVACLLKSYRSTSLDHIRDLDRAMSTLSQSLTCSLSGQKLSQSGIIRLLLSRKSSWKASSPSLELP